jgi:hypothetical protein
MRKVGNVVDDSARKAKKWRNSGIERATTSAMIMAIGDGPKRLVKMSDSAMTTSKRVVVVVVVVLVLL